MEDRRSLAAALALLVLLSAFPLLGVEELGRGPKAAVAEVASVDSASSPSQGVEPASKDLYGALQSFATRAELVLSSLGENLNLVGEALRKEIESLREGVSALQPAVLGVLSGLASSGQVVEVSSKLEEISSRLSSQDQALSALRGELEALSLQLKSISEALKAQEGTLSALRSRVEGLGSSLSIVLVLVGAMFLLEVAVLVWLYSRFKSFI